MRPTPLSQGASLVPGLPPGAEPPLIHLSTDFIRAKEYLEAIVSSTSDSICTTDVHGRLLYFSPGAERMLGYASAEVVGKEVWHFYPGGLKEASRVMGLLKRRGSLTDYEMTLRAKDGRVVHVSMSAAILRDKAGKAIGTLGISKDITRRIELERKLREMSITDELTGLYNQRNFHDRLESEASRARRQRYRLSMILLDLDGFKEINDEKGHLEGDRILRCVAAAIRDSIRKEVDSAFRYGGDEFVILLPATAEERARTVARRILSAARAKTGRRSLEFSFGIAALGPRQGLCDFVAMADRRMYAMKAARKGGGRKESSSVLLALNAPKGLGRRV